MSLAAAAHQSSEESDSTIGTTCELTRIKVALPFEIMRYIFELCLLDLPPLTSKEPMTQDRLKELAQKNATIQRESVRLGSVSRQWRGMALDSDLSTFAVQNDLEVTALLEMLERRPRSIQGARNLWVEVTGGLESGIQLCNLLTLSSQSLATAHMQLRLDYALKFPSNSSKMMLRLGQSTNLRKLCIEFGALLKPQQESDSFYNREIKLADLYNMVSMCQSLRELTLKNFISPVDTRKSISGHTNFGPHWHGIRRLCITPCYHIAPCPHSISFTLDLLASGTITNFEYHDPTYYLQIEGNQWSAPGDETLQDLRKRIISQANHFNTFSFTCGLFSRSYLDTVIPFLTSCHRVSLHSADFSTFKSIIIPGVQFLTLVGCFEHSVPNDDDSAQLRALILRHARTLRTLELLDSFEAFAFYYHTPDDVLEKLNPLIDWGKEMGFEVTYVGPRRRTSVEN